MARALDWQSRGREFESHLLHVNFRPQVILKSGFLKVTLENINFLKKVFKHAQKQVLICYRKIVITLAVF